MLSPAVGQLWSVMNDYRHRYELRITRIEGGRVQGTLPNGKVMSLDRSVLTRGRRGAHLVEHVDQAVETIMLTLERNLTLDSLRWFAAWPFPRRGMATEVVINDHKLSPAGAQALVSHGLATVADGVATLTREGEVAVLREYPEWIDGFVPWWCRLAKPVVIETR